MGFQDKIESANPLLSEANWKSAVDANTGSIAKSGYRWVGITLGLFLAWAVFMPLSSAVVSTGKIVSLGKNKLLQHPTGGVVRRIVSEDGALLEKGQLILEIEPAVARAELGRLLARQSLLLAQKKRILDSEGDIGESSTTPIAELRGTQSELVRKVSKRVSSSLEDVFKGQEKEFNAKSIRLASEYSALENQLAQQREERNGLQNQINQQGKRLALLKLQANQMAPLAANGYVAKAKLWDVQSQLLEAEGQQGSIEARLLTLDAAMDETRDRMAQLKASESEDNAKEYSAIVAELEGVNQQLDAAQVALEYSNITAPVAGTLVKFQANTIGGVVEAGAPFGEVVPTDNPLIVEARVLPKDIGEVRKGQEAEIVITAFNRRIISPIEGAVSYVSADSSIDQKTGESYFTVNVDLGKLPDDMPDIQPGMVSEVYIQTGSRSFLSYMMTPVTDSFRKAFNEQ